MSDRVRVWCLRHAESEANANVPGAAEDCGLTPLGRRQAADAAQQLTAEPIASIYSSTALRARQTAAVLAAAVAAAPRLPTTALPELAEADVTAEVLRAWIVDQDLGRRTRDGETGQEVVARVTSALQKVAAAHPGGTVALVGHVASLTVALGRLCSLGPGVWGTPLPHARPFLVEWDGHAWRCTAWPAPPPAGRVRTRRPSHA